MKSIKAYSTKQIKTSGGTAALIQSDVETIVQNMIDNSDLIGDALENYTTTTDLQANYATKTLLTNTLDNYATKDLLTQSLSEKADYQTTDALESTTINHEDRIKAVEDNFVSTTALTDGLATKANISHSHAIADISSLQTTLNNKANTSHSHNIADVTNLQAALNSKANSSHQHDFDDVILSSESLG